MVGSLGMQQATTLQSASKNQTLSSMISMDTFGRHDTGSESYKDAPIDGSLKSIQNQKCYILRVEAGKDAGLTN